MGLVYLPSNLPQKINHSWIGTYLGGGFKYFFMFIPTWGHDPI